MHPWKFTWNHHGTITEPQKTVLKNRFGRWSSPGSKNRWSHQVSNLTFPGNTYLLRFPSLNFFPAQHRHLGPPKWRDLFLFLGKKKKHVFNFDRFKRLSTLGVLNGQWLPAALGDHLHQNLKKQKKGKSFWKSILCFPNVFFFTFMLGKMFRTNHLWPLDLRKLQVYPKMIFINIIQAETSIQVCLFLVGKRSHRKDLTNQKSSSFPPQKKSLKLFGLHTSLPFL